MAIVRRYPSAPRGPCPPLCPLLLLARLWPCGGGGGTGPGPHTASVECCGFGGGGRVLCVCDLGHGSWGGRYTGPVALGGGGPRPPGVHGLYERRAGGGGALPNGEGPGPLSLHLCPSAPRTNRRAVITAARPFVCGPAGGGGGGGRGVWAAVLTCGLGTGGGLGRRCRRRVSSERTQCTCSAQGPPTAQGVWPSDVWRCRPGGQCAAVVRRGLPLCPPPQRHFSKGQGTHTHHNGTGRGARAPAPRLCPPLRPCGAVCTPTTRPQALGAPSPVTLCDRPCHDRRWSDSPGPKGRDKGLGRGRGVGGVWVTSGRGGGGGGGKRRRAEVGHVAWPSSEALVLSGHPLRLLRTSGPLWHSALPSRPPQVPAPVTEIWGAGMSGDLTDNEHDRPQSRGLLDRHLTPEQYSRQRDRQSRRWTPLLRATHSCRRVTVFYSGRLRGRFEV